MNEISRSGNTTDKLNIASEILSTDLITKVADLKALFLTTPDADLFVWIGYMGTIICVFITVVIFYFDFVLPAIAFAGRGLSSYSFGRLGQDLGLLARVADSTDPLEAAFLLMRVEDAACKKRYMCEVNQAAVRIPLFGYYMNLIRPTIKGKYQAAQDAGSALEDCALLFRECSNNVNIQEL
ncbi:uncharacterized protein LOC135219158 [Macrobrachium nipponense]|uniref:uncharacterized protein LOC135219158 n=1 Tax=Macrobrachium nipponense TaxID=159736 RepID=UPI0030C89CCF